MLAARGGRQHAAYGAGFRSFCQRPAGIRAGPVARAPAHGDAAPLTRAGGGLPRRNAKPSTSISRIESLGPARPPRDRFPPERGASAVALQSREPGSPDDGVGIGPSKLEAGGGFPQKDFRLTSRAHTNHGRLFMVFNPSLEEIEGRALPRCAR